MKTTASPPPPPAVAMHGITKRFPGVLANNQVDLTVEKGEIHALLGENGAGKSTLMNVLSGLYQQDEGHIEINGQPVVFHSPRDAILAGVGMVHQHFMLVPSQTVAENMILGRRSVGWRLRPRQIAAEVLAVSQEYGLPIDPQAKIWQLSVGEQQRVEIVKMLYRGASILILDEPTAVLTPQEVQELFRNLRQMTAAGATIIIISHKLDEVLSIADRITVLRGGTAVATVNARDVDKPTLASLMVGREVLFRLDKQASTPGDTQLVLENVHASNDKGLPALKGLSLTVRQGEIVGIAGVAGNGQKELTEVIYGMRPLTAGELHISGELSVTLDTYAMIDMGVAYVPEDRSSTGSAPNLSVGENLSLKSYRQNQGLFVNKKKLNTTAVDLIQRYQISTPSAETPARKLSGGNLQKLILARETSTSPRIIMAAYPSRGLDVGAIENVQRILLEEREKGAAILLLSEELEEIFSLADRIAVLYDGRIVGDLPIEEATIEQVGLLMGGDEQ
ncbi:MAG: ABC transporter ATP-binding protein [Anaerolineales bacterium]|nr:ABC transporter ATP-binding protein [Anaerolineales bacterium]